MPEMMMSGTVAAVVPTAITISPSVETATTEVASEAVSTEAVTIPDILDRSDGFWNSPDTDLYGQSWERSQKQGRPKQTSCKHRNSEHKLSPNERRILQPAAKFWTAHIAELLRVSRKRATIATIQA
jgi:hypothetical protein